MNAALQLFNGKLPYPNHYEILRLKENNAYIRERISPYQRDLIRSAMRSRKEYRDNSDIDIIDTIYKTGSRFNVCTATLLTGRYLYLICCNRSKEYAAICLHMAMKIEEVYPPRRYEVLSMFDVDATQPSLLKLEMIIMNRIGLMIQRPSSLQHLNILFAFLYTPKEYCMRGYDILKFILIDDNAFLYDSLCLAISIVSIVYFNAGKTNIQEKIQEYIDFDRIKVKSMIYEIKWQMKKNKRYDKFDTLSSLYLKIN